MASIAVNSKPDQSDWIALAAIFISFATLFILYMQYKEQKELWDLQKSLHSLDIQNKVQRNINNNV